MNYQKLYYKLIENATIKNIIYDSTIHHKHHIIPKCVGGNNDSTNIVILTHREHFVAHKFLTKIYPTNIKLKFAWNAMCNLHQIDFNRNSRHYLRNIKSIAGYLSENNKDNVYVNCNGQTIKVTKDEYASNNQLVFHTSGMVYCHDINGNTYYIAKDQYAANNQLYVASSSPLSRYTIKYMYTDTVEQHILYISKKEARTLNKNYRSHCFDNKLPIIKKRYKQTNTGKKRTDLPNYLDDSKYYRKKGDVVCWDKTNSIYKVVSATEFKQDKNLVGTTYNMATVYSPQQEKFIKISSKEAAEKGLRGPNIGKINVISLKTGIRSQKLRSELLNTDIPLGNKSLYITTGKTGVHYIEYKLGLKLFTLDQQQIDIFEQRLQKYLSSIRR